MDRSEYIERVRRYLKDNSDYNRLVEGEEFSDQDISDALDQAVADWNAIGRKTHYKLESIPEPQSLIMLAVSHLLIMGGIRRERNRLPYSDGGVTVSPDEKLQTYSNAASLLFQLAAKRIERYKLRLLFGYGMETPPPPMI